MNKFTNSDCIVPSIAGRLGNNMFMIAHAYAKALEQNKQMIVPKKQVGHIKNFVNNIFRKLDLYIDMPNDVLGTSANVFSGYFQSERYFVKYSEAVKQLFSAPIEFIKEAFINYPFLQTSNVTCISVRRGDYLIYSDYHPVITKEYIEEAIKRIPKTDYFVIFSDDLDWCVSNLNHLSNVHFISASIHEQMWLMSLCDNFVISNSSFSWWGAYLSRNKNKTVVAPQTWFGPRCPHGWEDIYCDGWIVLPTEYSNGYIYPKN